MQPTDEGGVVSRRPGSGGCREAYAGLRVSASLSVRTPLSRDFRAQGQTRRWAVGVGAGLAAGHGLDARPDAGEDAHR